MATAGSLLADVRVHFGDPDRDFITDAIGLEWLTAAQERLCHEVLALDEIKDYPLTSRQKRYDLPTNCIIPFTVSWWKLSTKKLAYVDPGVWDDVEVSRLNTTGTPNCYSVIRRQLTVGPSAPSSDSATSLASGAALSTATTIGLTAASGTFRTRGWLQNQTSGEVIEYTNISTTTVTGCTRGVHGPPAASIARGAQFKEIDLQMRYRKNPDPITATTASPEVPSVFQRYLEHYVLFLAWRARGDKGKADAAYNQFSEEEKRAKDTIGRRSFESRSVKDRRHMGIYGGGPWGDGM